MTRLLDAPGDPVEGAGAELTGCAELAADGEPRPSTPLVSRCWPGMPLAVLLAVMEPAYRDLYPVAAYPVDETVLQGGLAPAVECFDNCSSAWQFHIGSSLRNLIMKRLGQPNPREN